MNRSLRLLFCGVWCITLSGCYTYSAMAPEAVQPGANVRARITADQADRASELLGTESRILQGVVVRSDAEALILSISAVVGTTGLQVQRLRQNLPIPPSALLELEVRRLDKTRTAAVVAGAAAVAGYLVYEAFDTGGGSPGRGRGEGELARIPLFVIPLR